MSLKVIHSDKSDYFSDHWFKKRAKMSDSQKEIKFESHCSLIDYISNLLFTNFITY